MQNNTALVIIDVQLGMFAEQYPVVNGKELLATIGNLISRAHPAFPSSISNTMGEKMTCSNPINRVG